MHPGQPSGVVHPPRRRMNRCRWRRAGVAPTATLFSGIRYRYAAADSRGVARVPLTSIFLPVHICRSRATGSGLAKGCDQHLRRTQNPDTYGTRGYRPSGAVMSILAPQSTGPRTCTDTDTDGRAGTRTLELWVPDGGHGFGTYLSRLPAASETMSIRQPVSLAARRAFWPSLPMASDSW